MKNLRLITLLIAIISTLTTTLCAQPGNAKNPFDDAGINHNAGLDYIIKNRPDLSSKAKILTSVTALAEQFQKDKNGAAQVVKAYLESFDFSQSPSTLLDSKDLSIGRETKNQLKSLFDLVGNFKGDYTMVDQLIKQIIVWEDKISILPLTQKEKTILYSSGSIARYSASYWATVISSADESEWAKLVDEYYPGDSIQGKGFKGKFWQRIKRAFCTVVAYDIAGAILGGSTAVVPGAIIGGLLSSGGSAIIIGSGILGN